MAKILKITGRAGGILLEWILLFLIVFAFAIRTSPVQTYLAQQLTSYLSSELGAEISVERVSIIFLDKVELEGVLARDLQGDTIIWANSVYANLYDYNLQSRYFRLSEVEVDGARIAISRDTSGVFNYKFIQNYFSSDGEKKKSKVVFDEITVKNTCFSWDDNRKKRLEYGMDYFHILTRDIQAKVTGFTIHGREYSGVVEELECKERSGFRLNNLNTSVFVDSTGVYLKDVLIQSRGSRVEAKKFDMLSTGFSDFLTFVDSVRFDGRIDKSTIALTEGSLFAPILKGMNDTIRVSGTLSKKTKNLRLSNLNLRIKEKTFIKGTFNIPDYRKFDEGFFQEKVDEAYIDVNELKRIRLPDKSSERYFSINDRIERLSYFDVYNARLDGFFAQFVVAASRVKTRLGQIRMDNGLMFTENADHGSYMFERSGASNYDVKVEQFQLGSLLHNPDLGIIDGFLFLSGEAYSVSDVRFYSIEGDINRLDYLDYPYQNITVLDGELKDNVFTGKIDVKDDNLDLTYDGMVDFNKELHLLFTIDVRSADLDELNLTEDHKIISSLFNVDLRGKNPNDFRGSIHMDAFHLRQDEKEIYVPSINLRILRDPEMDQFIFESQIANGYLKGKLDINTILSELKLQVGKALPSLFGSSQAAAVNQKKNHFDFHLSIDRADDFMFIVYPDLQVSEGTTIDGNYDSGEEGLRIDVNSKKIVYKELKLLDANLHHSLLGPELVANYYARQIVVNDTIHFDEVYLNTRGGADRLFSSLIWEENTLTPSKIQWTTDVRGTEHFQFTLDPSYFFVADRRWDIDHSSVITLDNDTIHIRNFDLRRGEQSLNLDGTLSNSDDHHLQFRVDHFELAEISNLISDVPLEGTINAWGYFSNPLKNFQFVGDANIDQFKTRGQLVGDITVKSEWIKSTKSFALQGNLVYKGNNTFDFIGDYYPRRETDNLDFNLFFEYTDIQFTNAFMNPEIMSEIHGLLNGTLKVTGTPDHPILDGTVHLLGGSAKVDLLGAHFGIEGPITADESGFYIDGIPVFDEDGNAGLLIGSIYHSNFQDFNFDLLFDLEDDALNKDPLQPWLIQPLDKFLILNSQYKPGDLYYGTGYVRGDIDIFGYTDNLEINVDLETRKGTKIVIPMYGRGDIDEEDFVIFVDRDTTLNLDDQKIDFTGVDLNLNFHVTKDAEVKLVFNEATEDQITAYGSGDMHISLNNIGDVTMNGVYTVANGVYDFALGPVREKFFIKEGGNISWTGDPYEAFLNLRTYYKVNANIAAATNNQFASGSGAHQDIYCYLDLKESMNKPTIGFDLEAPGATEEAKSIVTRIRNDPDELNRQFFSLVLWKRFQPLSGSAVSGGNAAIDLLTNQINAILDKISDDYKLNVNMDSDALTGDNTYEFGVSKGFLNDRLILSGSFGVENRKSGENGQENSIIGDVNLEYLLNESGTFRVNIFNESNDKTIIQSAVQGPFTQGAGLNYKEDFHSIRDFKVVQYFLDIFRKKGNKRYPIKRKRRQTPVPQISTKPDAIIPEETNPLP